MRERVITRRQQGRLQFCTTIHGRSNCKGVVLASETALTVELTEESVALFRQLADLVRTKQGVGLIRIRGEHLAQRVNLHLALGGSFGP